MADVIDLKVVSEDNHHWGIEEMLQDALRDFSGIRQGRALLIVEGPEKHHYQVKRVRLDLAQTLLLLRVVERGFLRESGL
jgi:hypothetical protein